MNAFRVVVVVPLLLLLTAGTCERTDAPEAQPTDPCALAGLCPGAGGVVVDDRPGVVDGVDIIDDGRPVLRGVYLDDLDAVLASARATDELLGWLGAEGFERISCYDTGTIFDDPTSSARLATFIARARREAGVVEVAAVRGTVAGFTDVVAWNARVAVVARFNVLTLEHEWWNGAGTFAEHTRLLQAMHDVADRSPSPLVVDDYMGWLDNPGDDDGDGVADATAAAMAAALVDSTDRVMLHAYRSQPDFGYLTSRLAALSTAAAAAGRRVDVVVIFSAEDGFMGPWFQRRSFDDAWAELLRQGGARDPATDDHVDHVDLVGYQLFAASHAMAARPR